MAITRTILNWEHDFRTATARVYVRIADDVEGTERGADGRVSGVGAPRCIGDVGSERGGLEERRAGNASDSASLTLVAGGCDVS